MFDMRAALRIRELCPRLNRLMKWFINDTETLMHITRSQKFLFLTLVLATIMACSRFAAATPQPAATLDSLYTAAAQTLEAMSTQGAGTITPVSTGTLFVSTSSSTPFSTFTTVPPVQPVSRCDAAAFVSDVTYPDGANVSLGSTFTKTWRIQNVGTCTWTTAYALVFVSGERFGAPAAVSLPGNVAPGQSIDLSLNLTAPNNNGRFRGDWKLRNASGALFGVGSSASSNFYVDVSVTGYTVLAYDFVANYCEAAWENDSQGLPCPGVEGDAKGFVQVLNSPRMENGNMLGKALLTYPQKSNTGWISGRYPRIDIQSGDRFQALINCMHEANDCDATFRLSYQIGNGEIRTLGQWREVYEGQFYTVNIDLSSLRGQSVKFILTVFTNGNSHEDFALWMSPRITRQSSQPPTATATPSQTLAPTLSPTLSSATPTVTFTATATSTPTATGTATPTATP